MKLGTTSHPKFRRLQKLLKLPQYAVTGLLEMLWSIASQYADDGDISRFCSQEIADYCDWDGDADTLVDALVTCRWLDRDSTTNGLSIHDWEDHRPNYIADRIRKRETKSEKPCDSSTSFQEVPGVSEPFQEVPGKSPPNPTVTQPNHSQTKPNHAQPNQTKPLSSSTDWGSVWTTAGIEFRESVRELAERTSRSAAIRRVAIDRELIWQFAWIGTQFDRDAALDASERIRSNDVRKPKHYLASVAMKACDAHGESWDRLKHLVPHPPPPKQQVAVEAEHAEA